MNTEPVLHKFIGIEPITVSDEDNEKLEKFIKMYTKRFIPGPSTEATINNIKYKFLKKLNVNGICTKCDKLADYKVSYDCQGASLVQRYCSTCLDEERQKGNIERDY